MNRLVFSSELLEKTDRYSKDFFLPDFPWTEDGDFDRAAALETMLSEEYGFVRDEGVTVRVEKAKERSALYAGKCRKYVQFVFSLSRGERTASFPVDVFFPNTDRETPFVVALSFSMGIERCYCPLEELMGRGVAVAHVLYTDVSSDDGDFESGIAPLLVPDRADPTAAGKLAIWAYAANLIGRFLLDEGYAKPGKLFVSGHSRLGKTALLTAAVYPQFDGVHVNNSGCSGFAISREKGGETIAKICDKFPYWFAPAYYHYAERENEAPFDQHYLAALVAPRLLSVSTAEQDTWADTEAQYLCAEAASVVYEKCGSVGLDESGGLLTTPSASTAGRIGLFMRRGTHYFSRDDWNFFVDFLESKQVFEP